ncbi:MAG: M23 family metallopeptidase [Chlorobi bacterium]|nr:M23 family metallopeptidase [Chlorobiota bacterium]
MFKVVFILKILLILFFAFESYWVYVGLKAPDNTISIDFPLKHGTFVITSGGSSNMVNAHFEKEPYCYAVDIIKLNSYGRMWDKSFLKSEKLFDYPSFNDTVFAPCNGKIIEISDNKEDQPIGIEGKISNYIRIEYKEKYVIMLAHLKKNSMMVKLNESVISGQPIALIGNSGQSNDPHLHIHLVHKRLDIYMPFKFNGRFPIINDIFNN